MTTVLTMINGTVSVYLQRRSTRTALIKCTSRDLTPGSPPPKPWSIATLFGDQPTVSV